MAAETLQDRVSLCQAAAEQMSSALALLDQAGATRAAALLDQALHAIPHGVGEHLAATAALDLDRQSDEDEPCSQA